MDESIEVVMVFISLETVNTVGRVELHWKRKKYKNIGAMFPFLQ